MGQKPVPKILTVLKHITFQDNEITFCIYLKDIGEEPVRMGNAKFSLILDGIKEEELSSIQLLYANPLFNKGMYFPMELSSAPIENSEKKIITLKVTYPTHGIELHSRNLASEICPIKDAYNECFLARISAKLSDPLHLELGWDVYNSCIKDADPSVFVENIFAGDLKYNKYTNTKGINYVI